MLCRRCYGRPVNRVELAGEFHTCLCDDCLNAWFKHFKASEANAKSAELEASQLTADGLAQAGRAVDEVFWLEWVKDRDALIVEFFGLAEAFCQPLAVEPEEGHGNG